MTKHQQDAGGGALNGLGPKPLPRPAIKQEPLEGSAERDGPFLPAAHSAHAAHVAHAAHSGHSGHDKSPIDLGAPPPHNNNPALQGDSNVGGLGGEAGGCFVLAGWLAGGLAGWLMVWLVG